MIFFRIAMIFYDLNKNFDLKYSFEYWIAVVYKMAYLARFNQSGTTALCLNKAGFYKLQNSWVNKL